MDAVLKSKPIHCLRLTARDQAALRWLMGRCRFWITALKRRRKYAVQRGAGFDPEEAAAFKAVMELEKAAVSLLKMAGAGRRHPCR